MERAKDRDRQVNERKVEYIQAVTCNRVFCVQLWYALPGTTCLDLSIFLCYSHCLSQSIYLSLSHSLSLSLSLFLCHSLSLSVTLKVGRIALEQICQIQEQAQRYRQRHRRRQREGGGGPCRRGEDGGDHTASNGADGGGGNGGTTARGTSGGRGFTVSGSFSNLVQRGGQRGFNGFIDMIKGDQVGGGCSVRLPSEPILLPVYVIHETSGKIR